MTSLYGGDDSAAADCAAKEFFLAMTSVPGQETIQVIREFLFVALTVSSPEEDLLGDDRTGIGIDPDFHVPCSRFSLASSHSHSSFSITDFAAA